MLSLILAALCSLASAQDEPQEPSPKDELKKAADRTARLENYSFKLELDIEGLPAEQDRRPEIHGTFDRDKGLHMIVEGLGEFVRRGDKAAFRVEGGEWRILNGAGGNKGPVRNLLRQFKPPHEEMKNLGRMFRDLEKTDEWDRFGNEDGTLYKGPLTRKGARMALQVPQLIRRFVKEIRGQGKVWIGERGRVLRYTFELTLGIRFQENEFEVRIARTTELSDFDQTEVEIPEEAEELLRSEPAEGEGKKEEPGQEAPAEDQEPFPGPIQTL